MIVVCPERGWRRKDRKTRNAIAKLFALHANTVKNYIKFKQYLAISSKCIGSICWRRNSYFQVVAFVLSCILTWWSAI